MSNESQRHTSSQSSSHRGKRGSLRAGEEEKGRERERVRERGRAREHVVHPRKTQPVPRANVRGRTWSADRAISPARESGAYCVRAGGERATRASSSPDDFGPVASPFANANAPSLAPSLLASSPRLRPTSSCLVVVVVAAAPRPLPSCCCCCYYYSVLLLLRDRIVS